MREVWESYNFYVQKMKEDSSDDPHLTQFRERRCAASAVLQLRKGGQASSRKLPSVKGFV